MPDFWSHRLAAETAYVNSTLSADTFSPTDYKFYLLGAQGPDIFYYLNKTNLFSKKRYSKLGNSLHTEGVKELFESMLIYISETPHPQLVAYVLGFLSHYFMDAHCHPLICKWGPDSRSHKVVEMALDAKTIADFKAHPINRSKIKQLHPKKKEMPAAFGNFIRHLFEDLYEETIDDKTLARIDKDFRIVQWLLVHDIVGKVPFKTRIADKLGYDIKGIRYTKDLETVTRSWDYLLYKAAFLEGIDAATRAIEYVCSHLDDPEALLAFVQENIDKDYLGNPL